jgi:ATP adenylyltransferase
MEHLWSPWRMAYIQGNKDDDADEGCIFCAIRDGAEDDRVLYRSSLGYVVLNKFPYNPGHVVVVPDRHVGDLEDLTDDEHADLQALLVRAERALKASGEPHGFNIGLNLGAVAGAGIPEHLHWHLIPRWSGDANFMPLVGQTRVLPELLADTHARLLPFFADPDG